MIEINEISTNCPKRADLVICYIIGRQKWIHKAFPKSSNKIKNDNEKA